MCVYVYNAYNLWCFWYKHIQLIYFPACHSELNRLVWCFPYVIIALIQTATLEKINTIQDLYKGSQMLVSDDDLMCFPDGGMKHNWLLMQSRRCFSEWPNWILQMCVWKTSHVLLSVLCKQAISSGGWKGFCGLISFSSSIQNKFSIHYSWFKSTLTYNLM